MSQLEALTRQMDEEEALRAQKDQELLAVKITRAEVEELMKKMGMTDSEKASRILRQVGGKVSDAVRFCIFDFPELKKA